MKKRRITYLLAVTMLISSCGLLTGCKNDNTENSSEESATVANELTDAGRVTDLCDYSCIPIEVEEFAVTEDDVSTMAASVLESCGIDSTLENLTDETVSEYFADYDIDTTAIFMDFIREYLNDYSETCKKNAISGATEEYLLANCEVEVNEDYVQNRTDLYEKLFTVLYVSEDDNLENYIKNEYELTVEEAESLWYDVMYQQVSLEIILAEIAEREEITVSDEEYSNYISQILTEYPGYTETELYELYGYGTDQGKVFFMKQCVANVALDYVIENADVSILANETPTESVEDTEFIESTEYNEQI